MHGKVSRTGQRFFAHDRKVPTCPSAGESAQHLRLKALIASTARASGLVAELEMSSVPGAPGTAWRADVLVADPSGRRQVAFEVQLAAMTATEGAERTARYEADGIETVWIGTKATPWLGRIPSVRIDEESGRLDIGVARIAATDRDWVQWEHVPIELDRFLRTLFSGRLVATQVDGISVPSRSSYGDYVHPGWVFTKPELAAIAADKAELARRQRERDQRDDERRQAQLDQWLANTAALHQRQEASTEALITELRATEPDIRIQVGERRVAPPVDWGRIERKPLSANGIPVRKLVNDHGHGVLIAVVCPVAARITPKMAGYWAANNVQVIVATSDEADRVAAALGRRAASRIRVLR